VTVLSTPGVVIIRCPAHGIAYDPEREACPVCAAAAPEARQGLVSRSVIVLLVAITLGLVAGGLALRWWR
jgi:hypothetical protein